MKNVFHKLFKCPTFWRIHSSFTCPKCGRKYRCYWDGNDVIGHGIDYCDACAKVLENSNVITSDGLEEFYIEDECTGGV